MPKDEDILQLVSPSVCVEGPWEEIEGYSQTLLNWGFQAQPWAGAASCFTRACSGLEREEERKKEKKGKEKQPVHQPVRPALRPWSYSCFNICFSHDGA